MVSVKVWSLNARNMLCLLWWADDGCLCNTMVTLHAEHLLEGCERFYSILLTPVLEKAAAMQWMYCWLFAVCSPLLFLSPLFRILWYEVWRVRQNGVHRPLGWAFTCLMLLGQCKWRRGNKKRRTVLRVVCNVVSKTCSSLLHSGWLPINFMLVV